MFLSLVNNDTPINRARKNFKRSGLNIKVIDDFENLIPE